MGFEANSGQGDAAARGKVEQTEVTPSAAACFDVVEALKAERPSGKPLLELVEPGKDPDLTRFLFKQPNESNSDPDIATNLDSLEIGDMRPGLYGQKTPSDRIEKKDGDSALPKPSYYKDLREVFGKSEYFDLVRNHNQVITTPGSRSIFSLMKGQKEAERQALDAATQTIQQKPEAATTLFNFDAHSDMWMGKVHEGHQSIAQWVNQVLKKNPNINEVYWVLPEDFKSNPKVAKSYFNHKGSIPDEDTVFVHAPRDMTLYLDKESTALLVEKPAGYTEGSDRYRKIEFHKRTLSELPDFKGKRVAASIDLDFFDNRGYDTTYEASVKYQGDRGFAKFVQTLKEKNIRPEFTTVSASPEYVRGEHARDLLRFSSLVAEATKAKVDAVAVPKENQVYSGKGPHDGMQVDRVGNKALELFYELFKTDSQTRKPTDSLDLTKDGPKLKAAIEATKRIYQTTSNHEARDILGKLDAMDGKQNGVLEFESIESLLVRVCRTVPDARLRKDYRAAP